MSKTLKDELDNYKELVDKVSTNPEQLTELMSSLSVIVSETKRLAFITGYREETIKGMMVLAFSTGMEDHG